MRSYSKSQILRAKTELNSKWMEQKVERRWPWGTNNSKKKTIKRHVRSWPLKALFMHIFCKKKNGFQTFSPEFSAKNSNISALQQTAIASLRLSQWQQNSLAIR